MEYESCFHYNNIYFFNNILFLELPHMGPSGKP